MSDSLYPTRNSLVDPTLRLEISLSTAASDLAGLTPDSTTWHAWVEYFLYCLEEESLRQPAGQPAFETELGLLASAIRSRLSCGNWSSPPDPLPPP